AVAGGHHLVTADDGRAVERLGIQADGLCARGADPAAVHGHRSGAGGAGEDAVGAVAGGVDLGTGHADVAACIGHAPAGLRADAVRTFAARGHLAADHLHVAAAGAAPDAGAGHALQVTELGTVFGEGTGVAAVDGGGGDA